jgi:hypothetical protein
MNTNLIKNAIRNTKFRIDVEEKETPALNYNKGGLLSRTKSVKIDKQKEENDALRLAKMVKGIIPNA